MTADHDEDSIQADQDGGGPTRSSAPPFAVVMAAVLAVLFVVGLVSAAAGWWVSREPSEAVARLEQRADVVRVAEQFAVTVNNYDSESVDDYKSTVSELLSTKFKTEFDKAMEDIVVQVEEAQMSSKGTVLATGVAALEDDSARVLVVSDATVKTVFDERQRHFRWEVSLVKVDGEWLVDDFTPVA